MSFLKKNYYLNIKNVSDTSLKLALKFQIYKYYNIIAINPKSEKV